MLKTTATTAATTTTAAAAPAAAATETVTTTTTIAITTLANSKMRESVDRANDFLNLHSFFLLILQIARCKEQGSILSVVHLLSTVVYLNLKKS